MRQNLIDIIQEDCGRVTKDVSALSALKGERILITGGTGFIGTWLTELVSFLNDNYDFQIKLILLSGRAYNFSAKAPHLAMRKDVTIIERDVRSILDIPNDVSWIIHAAANPDNRAHASDPLKVIDVIVKGTESVLMASTRLPNLQKILNISSGLVYGSQPLELESIPENFCGILDFTSISSVYAEAKRMSETLCTVYRNQHRIPIVNARPFAFIGPYQLLDRPWAINNFIRDSLLGGPIRILGDGETVRSYMYPSDMAFWILTILVQGKSGLNYNVGSSHSITLKQLAEKVTEHLPSKPKIVSHVSENGNLTHSKFVPNVNLVQQTLNLNITVDIDTSIKRTILWNHELRYCLGAD